MIVPRLTEELIASLPFATASSFYVTESGRHEDGSPVRAQNGDRPIAGFGVRVHRASKVYVVRHQGRPHAIGRVDLLSLSEARTRARRKYVEILEGPPPAGDEARVRTVAALWEGYRESLGAKVRAGDLKRRTLAGYWHLWTKHLLPRFGSRTLSQVTPELLERWKAGLTASPVTFNRALQQLSAGFAYAMRLRWAAENPCVAVEPYGERPSARVLSDQEIVAWAQALAALEAEERVSPTTAAALWALFYSGARPGEILRAKAEWLTPVPTRSGMLARLELPEAKGDRRGKAERGRVVRVPPPAGEKLLLLERGENPWLIPGEVPGEPLRSVRSAFAAVCRRAGVKGASPKVLRHAWRSVAPEAGVDKEHTRQLGGWASHRVPDSVYSHQRDAALDEGAVKIADRLKEISREPLP